MTHQSLCGPLLILLASATAFHHAHAASSTFPTRPVRWVVPYPAGGPTDLLARFVGQKTGEILGQQTVVDSRPGANSIIGTEIVAKAQPDGHTLLLALPAFTINPGVYRKLPYDTARDFVPVTQIASASYLALVSAKLPIKSVSDLVAMAKAQPGKLSFGSGGTASPAHLAMELFSRRAGIDMVHVPYKGGAPALVDLVGGRIQVMVNPALSSLPFVKSGQLRVIGVTSAERSSLLPEVPTIAESGLTGYNVSTWYGLFAPKGTPASIVKLTYSAVHKALQDAQIREQLRKFDATPVGNTPEQFAKFVQDELKTWMEIIKAANIEQQ